MNNTPAAVIRTTARLFGVPTSALTDTNRAHSLVSIRRVALWAARRVTGLSFPELARPFNRHYSTLIHAYHRVTPDEADYGRQVMAMLGHECEYGPAILKWAAELPPMRQPSRFELAELFRRLGLEHSAIPKCL